MKRAFCMQLKTYVCMYLLENDPWLVGLVV